MKPRYLTNSANYKVFQAIKNGILHQITVMSKCAKCQKEFKCCANTDEKCWCNELNIAQKELEYLSQTYAACLCPECLSLFEKKQSTKSV